MALVIRRARPDEADTLTSLAVRSKAHWGYDAAFMDAALPDLRIGPELIAAAAAYVAEHPGPTGALVGVYVLSVEEGVPTLRDLWVDPSAIGTGVGSALYRHMLDTARAAGFRTVRIEADPNAEAFYAKMGASRVGSAASKVVPGRRLPVLEVRL